MKKIKPILISLMIMLLLLMPIKSEAMNLYEMVQFFEIMTNTKEGRQFTEPQIIMLLNQSQKLVFPYMPDMIMEYFAVDFPAQVDYLTYGGSGLVVLREEVLGDSLLAEQGLYRHNLYRYIDIYKGADDIMKQRNFADYVMTDDVSDVLSNPLLAPDSTKMDSDNPIFFRITPDQISLHGFNLADGDTVHVRAIKYPGEMVGFIKGVTLGSGTMTFNISAADNDYRFPNSWGERWITNYGPNHKTRTRFYRAKTSGSIADDLGSGSTTIKLLTGTSEMMWFGTGATPAPATDEYSIDSDYPEIVHPIIVMTAAFLANLGIGEIDRAVRMDAFIKSVVAPLFQRAEEKESILPTKRNIK